MQHSPTAEFGVHLLGQANTRLLVFWKPIIRYRCDALTALRTAVILM
jgi:hypothetical protein